MQDPMGIISRVGKTTLKKSKESVRNQKHRNKECLWQLPTGLNRAIERTSELRDKLIETSQVKHKQWKKKFTRISKNCGVQFSQAKTVKEHPKPIVICFVIRLGWSVGSQTSFPSVDLYESVSENLCEMAPALPYLCLMLLEGDAVLKLILESISKIWEKRPKMTPSETSVRFLQGELPRGRGKLIPKRLFLS